MGRRRPAGVVAEAAPGCARARRRHLRPGAACSATRSARSPSSAGRLVEGGVADVCVFDPDERWRVEPARWPARASTRRSPSTSAASSCPAACAARWWPATSPTSHGAGATRARAPPGARRRHEGRARAAPARVLAPRARARAARRRPGHRARCASRGSTPPARRERGAALVAARAARARRRAASSTARRAAGGVAARRQPRLVARHRRHRRGRAQARFVSKAEVRDWPLLGRLVTAGGTLYHRARAQPRRACASCTTMAAALRRRRHGGGVSRRHDRRRPRAAAVPRQPAAGGDRQRARRCSRWRCAIPTREHAVSPAVEFVGSHDARAERVAGGLRRGLGRAPALARARAGRRPHAARARRGAARPARRGARSRRGVRRRAARPARAAGGGRYGRSFP